MNVVAINTETTKGIANERELRRFVADRGSHKSAPIKVLTQAIRISLELADGANIKAHHYRLDAGRMFVALRERIERSGKNFWEWRKQHFADRSRRDIEKLIAMAKSEDPEEAAFAARERDRQYQARHRAKTSAKSTAADISRKMVPPDDEEEEDSIDEMDHDTAETPHNYFVAFLIRADQARVMALDCKKLFGYRRIKKAKYKRLLAASARAAREWTEVERLLSDEISAAPRADNVHNIADRRKQRAS